MDAAILELARGNKPSGSRPGLASGQLINAVEFQRLLVSHRRMVRVDRRAEHVRGLQDLDTGEVFLTDERRLLDGRR
jgi:hypothetical protein